MRPMFYVSGLREISKTLREDGQMAKADEIDALADEVWESVKAFSSARNKIWDAISHSTFPTFEAINEPAQRMLDAMRYNDVT